MTMLGLANSLTLKTPKKLLGLSPKTRGSYRVVSRREAGKHGSPIPCHMTHMTHPLSCVPANVRVG